MRKAVLLGLVCYGLMSAPLWAATPQPRVRIAYASISSIFAGLWVAKETGAFEKYGVRGELLYIGAGQRCGASDDGRRS